MEILTIIFSGLLTVLTGYYVWLTHKISKTNSDLLQEQIRPFVVVRFEIIDLFLKIIIENIGQRPAYNIKVKFSNLNKIEEMLSDDRKGENLPYLAKDGHYIAFLAPNYQFKDLLVETPKVYKNDDVVLPDLFISLEYLDSHEATYRESYKVDLNNITHPHKMMEFSQNYHLSKIEKEIKSVSDQVKVLVRKIDKNN